jgi:hypothetical protein
MLKNTQKNVRFEICSMLSTISYTFFIPGPRGGTWGTCGTSGTSGAVLVGHKKTGHIGPA